MAWLFNRETHISFIEVAKPSNLGRDHHRSVAADTGWQVPARRKTGTRWQSPQPFATLLSR
jgi:hypothetical protein